MRSRSEARSAGVVAIRTAMSTKSSGSPATQSIMPIFR
jgi:hypothetical protein